MWSRFNRFRRFNRFHSRNAVYRSIYRSIYPVSLAWIFTIRVQDNQGEHISDIPLPNWFLGLVGIGGVIGAIKAYNKYTEAMDNMKYLNDDVVFEGGNVSNGGKTVVLPNGSGTTNIANSYNSGIHAFRIRWTHTESTPNCNIRNRIAITDENGGKYCYYWHRVGDTLTSQTYNQISFNGKTQTEYIQNPTKVWKSGDQMSIILDCFHWKVSFIMQDGTMYQVPIALNKTYRLMFEKHDAQGVSRFDIIPINPPITSKL